jgi:methyltransferase-like protein
MTQDYPERRFDLQARVVEGEMVVLDRKGGLIHQLNQTASYIWERLDGKTPISTIVNMLAESFEVDLKTAERDAAEVASQLQKLNLLESGGEGQATEG